jgi:tRNA-splicing ligase RtcB
VVPYAVGVDIACRMKLSLFDRPVSALDDAAQQLTDALERGTRFGVGSQHETPKHHPVLDEDWTITSTTRNKRDIAWKQLGTSGSGNHFVEFGEVEISDTTPDAPVPAGTYLGLLSHSGSRGAGAAVCQTYSSIARKKLPRHLQDFAYLAWLSLDSEAGQEYWAAMNLMGRYAAANHEVIHNTIAELIGGQIVSTIENHHNFAWIEQHNNRSLVVHRKGATPAGTGVLGVIPGTLADPAYIVRGKGNAASLCSASHGAGRAMSRREANDRYRWKAVAKQLESQHIAVVSTGNDEVPAAYKDIRGVMAAQDDLVEVLGTFQPRIVKMCGDGSKAED